MGRKRIDPEEVIKSVTLNLKQRIITEIEKEANEKDVKVKTIIEDLVTKKYDKQ